MPTRPIDGGNSTSRMTIQMTSPGHRRVELLDLVAYHAVRI
jgi:hypothetical protein